MHSIKDTVKQLIGKSLDAYNKKYTSPINNRIDNIVAQAGTDNTEIVDARIDSAGVSHTTLNNRILAETKMTDEKLIEYSGSSLSVEDTMPGYLQNIEIKGNTIQNEENLADIRSVGDKVEGQELYEIPVLSRGKNLFDGVIIDKAIDVTTGSLFDSPNWFATNYIKVDSDKITFSTSTSVSEINNLNFTIVMYDTNYNVIGDTGFYNNNLGTWILNPDTKYIRVRLPRANYSNIQIEEGAQVTPYEPYQEDKLTILSPVQLEKVGDVVDRIIEKDGVWGVEKNIKTDLLCGANNEDFRLNKTLAKGGYQFTWGAHMGAIANKNSEVISSTMKSYVSSNEDYSSNIWIYDGVIYVIHHPTISTADEIKLWLQTNPTIVKFPTNMPQFIPLPHSQQVKLRTFANKTNISFLTEIEGTIKAQVPKSLGATVNTHTTQISNLNKELDRVKKLEESTVSTVETESDFTTVEATSNGYFEDVKLEGKTLVNLANNSNNIPNPNINQNVIHPRILDVRSKNYTLVIKLNTSKQLNCKYSYTDGTLGNDFKFCDANVNGVVTKLITPNMLPIDFDKEVNGFRLSVVGGTPLDVTIDYIELLEGDHTQNPPSGYIEGLKSVGQDVDEIVVSSVKGDGNLFGFESKKFNCSSIDWYDVQGVPNMYSDMSKKTQCQVYLPAGTYTVGYDGVNSINVSVFQLVSIDDKVVVNANSSENFKGTKFLNEGVYTIRVRNASAGEVFVKDVQILKGDTFKPYTPHQSDKKRLLFYNEETQTWEKPILRQWDSIEKHSDGKYYYHKRSEECVLDGSVGTFIVSVIDNNDYIRWYRATNTIIPKAKVGGRIICDTLNNETYEKLETRTCEGIGIKNQTLTDLGVTVLKSRYSATTNTELNSQLASKPITFIYEINEEVYECTNIDLITYSGETNYIVESGVISPKSALKVHNNISNVVSLLQKKVSLLEGNITSYMITQNRMQLASTYSADSVTFKVDYALCSEEAEYNEDLYNLILNNILVGKDNYNYDKMLTMILDYASWNQISWEQFDILVGLMDMQHNPPVEEEITEDESIEETPVE